MIGPLQNGMNFEFVVSTPSHNAAKEERTKRLVRKHVMRPFRRRKRLPRMIALEDEEVAEYLSRRQRQCEGVPSALSPSAPPGVLSYHPSGQFHNSVGSPSIAAALLGASRPNPFGRYPINMSSREHELVHHIWASGQVIFQPFREYWFSLGMVDPAAMNLVIANAAMHRQALLGNPNEDVVEILHVAAAIRSVNERIGNPGQNVSDEILGAILGLMCHDALAVQYDRCTNHLDGFQTIIDLRGGLASIDSAVYIRLSLFWIELNICSAQDSIPRFPIPFNLIGNPYSAVHLSHGLQYRETAMQAGGLYFLMSSTAMFDIFTELSFLVVALTAEPQLRVPWDADNFPGFGFYPTLHKLLSMQTSSSEDSFEDPLQEMCRLGAILFLAEIRRKFGISPVVTAEQTLKLRSLLERKYMLWVKELDHIRTWTLLIAGCAADIEADRCWAMKTLLKSREHSEKGHYTDVIEIASKMWWIDEVFLPKSQELLSEFET